MPYLPVDVIEVRCWDRTVGAVALDPRSGAYAFEFDPAWRATGVELAPTTMPAATATGPYVFPTLARETWHGLPAMLADSLPDAFGNALTTAWLAAQGVQADQITPLDRLAYLGNRAMGAVEFRPVRGPRTRKATAIELGELVVAAREALHGEVTTEAGLTDALRHLIAVGTSAGGARAKAVVALDPATGELRTGQLPADPGFQQWLIKLDGVGQDAALGTSGGYGRIEYAYALMARAAGIQMMDCRLLEEGGRAHFMTRRFDREQDGAKVHIQTLCAMAHLDFRLIGAHDYAQLFEVIERLGLDPMARAEAYRRMVFNVAAANCDDHTKNTSFVLPRDGRWALAPAYDVTHAHAPNSRWTRQHLMAVNGQATSIARSDLRVVGERFMVPSASRIVDEVLAVVAQWESYAANAGVAPDATTRIRQHIDAWSAPLA